MTDEKLQIQSFLNKSQMDQFKFDITNQINGHQ